MGRDNLNSIVIIAPHYNYFIKGQIEALASLLPKTKFYVFVRYNPLIELLSSLPFNLPIIRYIRNFSKRILVPTNKTPQNVHIFQMRIPYIKPDRNSPELGEKIYKKISDQLVSLKIKPDLIHSHFIYHYGIAGALIKKDMDAPLIITAHGDDVYLYPFKNNTWFTKIKYTLDIADYIITVSNKNKEILTEKLSVPKNKVSVIPNGFDSKIFHPIDKEKARDKLGLPLNKKILLNVANLVPPKGHRYLISAMKKIVNQRNDVLLVIVGDGLLKKQLEKQVIKSNLKHYVRLTGVRPHFEIPLWMNAADIFVLPSLSEGNPTVMFEALGIGLPFIGTTVGGVPEIIISNEYGLLCPPKDPECLAENILIALNQEWDREKIRKYGKHFTWDNIAKRILKVYEAVRN